MYQMDVPDGYTRLMYQMDAWSMSGQNAALKLHFLCIAPPGAARPGAQLDRMYTLTQLADLLLGVAERQHVLSRPVSPRPDSRPDSLGPTPSARLSRPDSLGQRSQFRTVSLVHCVTESPKSQVTESQGRRL